MYNLQVVVVPVPEGVLYSVFYAEASKMGTESTLCWTLSLIISSLCMLLAAACIKLINLQSQ